MTKKKHTKFYPTVSVCTPTFNRRPFINVMFECFKNQTYPRDKTEWIIIDDGTDKIKDLVEKSGISQIKYFELDTKLTLGAKRNLMHEKTTGDIIVYMDDDDYYPPERIQHAVDMLMSNKEILIAGSSEMYVYFKHINKMYQAGPYNQNHATAATFAFRKELLNITRYNETKSLAEEKEFLKNYSIPMIQLDPLKTILVFSHIHILYDIEQVLEEYKPGLPNLKPDVLKQISETKKTRLNEELKFHHSNFIRCVLELENSTIDVKPITEVECLKKLNMDLIIQLRNLSKMYEEKCAELNKRQTGEWDLVEKTE